MSWLFGLGISMSWFFSLRISMSWLFVLWKNALESRCRGLFVFISRGVLVPESRCRVFWSWNLGVVVFWSWNLGVVVSWSWNPDVVIFWSWNPNVVVYVPPQPRFRYHRENKKIKHNYVNYVVEKYFSCPNLWNIYLHNICMSELE